MWIVFATNPAPYLSIVIGICGLGGLIFAALRFRRDDTTTVISQQTTILDGMKMLNDELRTTADTLRGERDLCHKELLEVKDKLDGG